MTYHVTFAWRDSINGLAVKETEGSEWARINGAALVILLMLSAAVLAYNTTPWSTQYIVGVSFLGAAALAAPILAIRRVKEVQQIERQKPPQKPKQYLPPPSERTMSIIPNVPADVWAGIFSGLSTRDLLNFSKACKLFEQISRYAPIWNGRLPNVDNPKREEDGKTWYIEYVSQKIFSKEINGSLLFSKSDNLRAFLTSDSKYIGALSGPSADSFDSFMLISTSSAKIIYETTFQDPINYCLINCSETVLAYIDDSNLIIDNFGTDESIYSVKLQTAPNLESDFLLVHENKIIIRNRDRKRIEIYSSDGKLVTSIYGLHQLFQAGLHEGQIYVNYELDYPEKNAHFSTIHLCNLDGKITQAYYVNLPSEKILFFGNKLVSNCSATETISLISQETGRLEQTYAGECIQVDNEKLLSRRKVKDRNCIFFHELTSKDFKVLHDSDLYFAPNADLRLQGRILVGYSSKKVSIMNTDDFSAQTLEFEANVLLVSLSGYKLLVFTEDGSCRLFNWGSREARILIHS